MLMRKASGISPKSAWVSEQLGRAKVSTTLDVYSHALPREARDLAFCDFAVGTRISWAKELLSRKYPST